MKEVLDAMIKATIKKAYIPEAQSKAPPEAGLGLIISKYFEWDGLAILKTLSYALEDANFHAENEEIRSIILRIEKVYEVA